MCLVFVFCLSYRRNVGFWCEMGMDMQVVGIERALKKALRALAASEDVLVHCKRGKHRSSAFLCFLLRVFNEPLQTIVNDYCQDAFLYIGERKYVLRATMESGWW